MEQIAAAMQDQEERVRKQSVAVLVPYHGLFVLAKDLESGFDAFERLDGNAYCLVLSRLLA